MTALIKSCEMPKNVSGLAGPWNFGVIFPQKTIAANVAAKFLPFQKMRNDTTVTAPVVNLVYFVEFLIFLFYIEAHFEDDQACSLVLAYCPVGIEILTSVNDFIF